MPFARKEIILILNRLIPTVQYRATFNVANLDLQWSVLVFFQMRPQATERLN